MTAAIVADADEDVIAKVLKTAGTELTAKIEVNIDKAEAIKKTIEGTDDEDVVEAIEKNEILVSTIIKGADQQAILEVVLANEELKQMIREQLIIEDDEDDFKTAKDESEESEVSEDSEDSEVVEEEKKRVEEKEEVDNKIEELQKTIEAIATDKVDMKE